MPSLLDIGMGKVGGNRYQHPSILIRSLLITLTFCSSHPVHPATVHLPIAFILAASVLDILSYLAVCFPSFFDSILNIFARSYASTSAIAIIYHLSLFSYASTIIGILTAIPAVVTGAIEANAIVSANGFDLSNPKVKTTVIHATLNDLAVLGAVYNWLTRRNEEDFMPWGGNALVSAGMLGLIAYAAFLGGSLVYAHGVAVQRMGKGKEEKEKSAVKKKK
jgi:uncharacterized membrane protein